MTTLRNSKSEIPAFGDEIARLRSRKKWSRSMLIKRLSRTLITWGDDKDYSEAWLFRLENGEIVKIPRRIVIGLAEALQCTLRERARLLLLADKNILFDPETELTEVKEMVNYLLLLLYEDVSRFLSDVMENRNANKLDDEELKEIFFAAIEEMIEEQRSRESPQQ